MGDVIDLFSRQQVPAAEGSDFVAEFIENELGEFFGAVEELHRAENETEFRKWLIDLRYQANRWPI